MSRCRLRGVGTRRVLGRMARPEHTAESRPENLQLAQEKSRGHTWPGCSSTRGTCKEHIATARCIGVPNKC